MIETYLQLLAEMRNTWSRGLLQFIHSAFTASSALCLIDEVLARRFAVPLCRIDPRTKQQTVTVP